MSSVFKSERPPLVQFEFVAWLVQWLLAQGDEPRFGTLGMDLLGNRLFVSFTIREGRIRVISIRPMSLGFIAELKKEALVRGVPYQILMRMFIIEGFERMKKTGT